MNNKNNHNKVKLPNIYFILPYVSQKIGSGANLQDAINIAICKIESNM